LKKPTPPVEEGIGAKVAVTFKEFIRNVITGTFLEKSPSF
jgi:hypothetical protein